MPPPIFPGAEGFGTTGYAGSGRHLEPWATTVYKVTNLNAAGAGSLANAVAQATPRTIIFEVSGTIQIDATLDIANPYCTIAGETAPSPGITLRGTTVRVRTHDVLVKHIRIRVGDDGGVAADNRDAVQIEASAGDVYNVVFDHVSASWAIDGNIDFWFDGTYNNTISNCIISEGLHDSLHSGDPHSTGMLIGHHVDNTTVHHSLFAHNYFRNPRIQEDSHTEFVNNLIYNYGNFADNSATYFSVADVAVAEFVDAIGNYYKVGNDSHGFRPVFLETDELHADSEFYLSGNIGTGRATDDLPEWNIARPPGAEAAWGSAIPVVTRNVTTVHSAAEAFDFVLANAGARPLDRDSVDIRVVSDVTNGTGDIIDSQADVGGWPVLAENTRALTVPADPDDEGEDGYTILENWIHGYAAALEGDGNGNGNGDGDIVVAVTRAAATVDVAPYTQDFTTDDLGGETPKAAFFVITRAITDGVAADHANFGIGATDGTNEWAAAFTDEHGQDPSDSNRRIRDTKCLMILNVGETSIDGEAEFSSFIADGIRVNWTDAPAAAYLVTVVLFAGEDLSAHVDTKALGNAADNAVDIADPGFEPNLVICGVMDFLDFAVSVADTDARSSIGVVHNDGEGGVTQRTWAQYWQDNQGTTLNAMRYTESYGVMAINGAGTLDWGGEFGDFDANGWTVTTRNAGANDSDIYYLALKFAGLSSWVGTIDTPYTGDGGTGNHAVIMPGFVPQFVMLGMTMMEAVDTAYTDDLAGSLGIGAFDDDDEYANSVCSEDNAAAANTQSLSNDIAVQLPDDDGAAGLVANFVSFDTNGWTLNYTTVNANAKKFWAFAIEEVAASASVAVSLI